MRADIQKNVRFNFTVNVLDGAFFGFALGFASYVTVIPLFISTLTDSSVVIGLVAAMHGIGWQLPQLFTANRVARLRRYKPMSLLMTLNERVPFVLLAIIAFAIPVLGKNVALILSLLAIIWQAMGGGLTGTAWQSMIAKIFPPEIRGTFYGTQSAAANLASSASAVIGGVILSRVLAPNNFALCFIITAAFMAISFACMSLTREPEAPAAHEERRSTRDFWKALKDILRRDHSFRIFLGVRMLSQVASVGSAFFTVYAVRQFGMDAGTAGIMTGVLLLGQSISNPLLGWLGDHTSHRLMFALGILLAGAGAAVALFAPSLEWFYLVFALAGFANASLWTTAMAMTVEFGTEEERPYYIGLANTLIAPATIIAPLIGGVLADGISYQATFAVAAICAVITVLLVTAMRDPRKQVELETLVPMSPYVEQP
ncbi:MAG: MFS transporter [Chloroflexi bacterium]|nr:MFS transporter [Chloroflexota bacterium]